VIRRSPCQGNRNFLDGLRKQHQFGMATRHIA
jgi:hypothetical protein